MKKRKQPAIPNKTSILKWLVWESNSCTNHWYSMDERCI